METTETRGQRALMLARSINARLAANGGPTWLELDECRTMQRELIKMLREDLDAAEDTTLGDQAVISYLVGKETNG